MQMVLEDVQGRDSLSVGLKKSVIGTQELQRLEAFEDHIVTLRGPVMGDL